MNVTDTLPPDRIDPRTIPEGIRQEALLRGLFSAVPEAVVLLDVHDRILKANPEFTKIFGYAQEDACGHLIKANRGTAWQRSLGRFGRNWT